MGNGRGGRTGGWQTACRVADGTAGHPSHPVPRHALPPRAPAPPPTARRAARPAHSQADIQAVKDAAADESISAEQLKEKVEALKKSSMKIGEAMYKNADGGEGGGEQSADYQDVKKDGDDKKEEKKEGDEKK